MYVHTCVYIYKERHREVGRESEKKFKVLDQDNELGNIGPNMTRMLGVGFRLVFRTWAQISLSTVN